MTYITENYITKTGDTCYKIANMYYFCWHLWRIIYDNNVEQLGDNPYYIPPGKKIKIPKLNTENIEHTIVSGDTWQRLSKTYYGTPYHFIDIAIINDYKHLIADAIAIIPPLTSQKNIADAEKAREKACL